MADPSIPGIHIHNVQQGFAGNKASQIFGCNNLHPSRAVALLNVGHGMARHSARWVAATITTIASRASSLKRSIEPIALAEFLIFENIVGILKHGFLRFLTELSLKTDDIAQHRDHFVVPFPL